MRVESVVDNANESRSLGIDLEFWQKNFSEKRLSKIQHWTVIRNNVLNEEIILKDIFLDN